MGNSHKSQKLASFASRLKSNFYRSKICPTCNKLIKGLNSEIDNHIFNCQKSYFKNILNESDSMELKFNKTHPNKLINIQPINTAKPNSFNFNEYGNLSFDNKIKQFRKHLETHKVSWTEGCCYLNLTRHSILETSITQWNKIDPKKELKINFKGEVSNDAGGLIREWFTVVLKEIQDPARGLFKRSDNDEYSHVINPNARRDIVNLGIFNFLGKIIAKALLENLTINTCFNKILYLCILEEELTYKNLVFVDNKVNLSLYSCSILSSHLKNQLRLMISGFISQLRIILMGNSPLMI